MFDHTVKEFLIFFGLEKVPPHYELLCAITKAFSNIPYENATKIIKKKSALSQNLSPLRMPDEVFGNYREWGTGGTCFSLCYLLLHIMHYCGFAAHLVMCNRRYGDNTHCAIICYLNKKAYLLDPGFLLDVPVHLQTSNYFQVSYALGRLVFEGLADNHIKVSTMNKGKIKERYVLKNTPVTTPEFMDYWLASFDFKGLDEVLITTLVGGKQIYLRGDYLREESSENTQSQKIQAPQLSALLTGLKINQEIIFKAYESV